MIQAQSTLPIADRLEHALGAGKLPPHMRDWGQQLLGHLRKPVQVVVMGLPGCGKSTLVNMLAGERVMPKSRSIPVIEIAHGAEPKVLFELEDGSMLRHRGTLADAEIPPGAIRALQELPEPGLERQNFVEVDLTGNFGYQKSIVNWVVQWADIVLWCTQEFSVSEQELWATVPEEIKDRSFLVLTKADKQLMRGTLTERITGLEALVAEEFLGLYPLATIQAIAARSAEGNPALWRSSGGKELLDVVQRQIAIGREADLDRAHMLLNRFDPETAPDRGTPRRAVTRPLSRPAPSQEARPQPAGGVFGDALGLLQASADDMFGGYARGEAPNPDAILQKCVDAANALSDLFDAVQADDPAVQDAQDDAQESAEMMVLFQLEKGEEAATDAVTLLMQLKKELAERAGDGPA